MSRVRLKSKDGMLGMAAASRRLNVNRSTMNFWCDRGEIVPDKVVNGRRRFRPETLDKFAERIEHVGQT